MNQSRSSASAGQPGLAGHVVVVGWGRVGHHTVDVLAHVNVPRLVVEMDAARVEDLQRQQVPTLFGDAANSEILSHAGLERARALVVTVPDEAGAALIIAAARRLTPEVAIIARAATQDGVGRLATLGAEDVIHPELEGGLTIVRRTLLRLGLPLRDVQKYTDIVRRDHYPVQVDTPAERRILHRLLDATPGIEVTWVRLVPEHPLVGQNLVEADTQACTGASVVALPRDDHPIPNPKSSGVFKAEDRVGLIGDPDDVNRVRGVARRVGVFGIGSRLSYVFFRESRGRRRWNEPSMYGHPSGGAAGSNVTEARDPIRAILGKCENHP